MANVVNRDYMVLGDTEMTPDKLRGRFRQLREKFLNLPLEQAPIAKESTRFLHADQMSETQKYMLDHSNYDFDNPQDEKRFRTKFEFYENLLLARTSNITSAMTLKGRMLAEFNEIDIEKKKILARSVHEYGKTSEMGNSASARESWLWWKYPALCEIHEMYKGFLEEIENELERLDANQRDTSRALTAFDQTMEILNISSTYKKSV